MTRIPRCKECRRALDAAETHIVHRGENYTTYHRCECGKEWTTVQISDHAVVDPVTSGEVLRVHELMKPDQTLTDLLASGAPK